MMSADLLAINGGAPLRTARLPLHEPWFDEPEQQPVEMLAISAAFTDAKCEDVLTACTRVFAGLSSER